jgi:hypothetical protein
VSVSPMRVVSLPLRASEMTLLPDAVSEDMNDPETKVPRDNGGSMLWLSKYFRRTIWADVIKERRST